jgi:hypothetical protein
VVVLWAMAPTSPAALSLPPRHHLTYRKSMAETWLHFAQTGDASHEAAPLSRGELATLAAGEPRPPFCGLLRPFAQ